MADDKKRILIVDDDIGVQVDTDLLLKNANVNAEVIVAHDQQEAIQQLDAWARQGHAADIVDVDYFVPAQGYHTDAAGLYVTKKIMEWAATQPEAVRPRKHFMHSKIWRDVSGYVADDRELKGKVTVYDAIELKDIGHYGEGHEHATNFADTTDLRRYLNKTFGTQYPTDSTQLNLLRKPDTKLGLWEAISAVDDSTINPDRALKQLDVEELQRWVRPRIDKEASRELNPGYDRLNPDFDRGIGGALSGHLAFSEEEATRLRAEGKKAILVLEHFTPADTRLLSKVDGIILLGKGTEHLEVVVANHGIPAVMGNNFQVVLKIEDTHGKKRLVNKPLSYAPDFKFIAETGDAVTISPGGVSYDDRDREVIRGDLYKGALPIAALELDDESPVLKIMKWADDARQKNNGYAVKANADTPEQVTNAIELGAEGVGLLRTEHMFFAKERLEVLQRAVLTDEASERQKAFASLKQFQKDDFKRIFETAAKAGREFPITIRLLDAPPEEFFAPEQVAALKAKVGADNMRGVQLAQKVPGLYAMQAEAIFEAAKETAYSGKLEVMVPLVRTVDELRAVKAEIAAVAERHGMKGHYQLRAMIETADAVKAAAVIAKEADGISFGTNDLTAEAINIKRDDIAAAREWMARNHHVGKSPFLTLAKPVQAMMQQTVEAARKANPAIDIGICGHQVASDPASLEFCQQVGLDSVSVPASAEHLISSRVIAGQAALNHPRQQRQDGRPKITAFTAMRKPRSKFTDTASPGTTSPGSNDRDSRNDQWNQELQ